MDLKDIQNLIRFVAKSGASEVKLETDDVKITIKTGSEETTIVQQMPMAGMPQMQMQQAAPAATTPPTTEQALNAVASAARQARLTYDEHAGVDQCVKILAEAIGGGQ